MNPYIKGVLLTSLSAVLFGLNPFFVNLLQNSNAGVPFTLLIRFAGSAIVFLILMLIKKTPFVLIRDSLILLKIFISSAFFLLTAFLLIYSYTKVPSGLATVLHFSYPIIIMLMSIKAKRDVFNIPLGISIFFSILGVVFVTNPFNMELDLMGVFASILSAFTFAVYLFMLNDKQIKTINNNVFVFYLSLFSLFILIITLLFLNSPFKAIQLIKPNSMFLLGSVGFVLASAFGVSLFSYGARKVGGPIAGTISAFEPLTAVLVGWLFLDEKTPSSFILGLILIIISVIIVSLFSRRSKKAKVLA